MSATLTAAPPAKLTPDDLLRLPDQGKGFELVDGKLVELNVSNLSSFVAGEIYGQVRDHVKPRRLGWVFPEGQSYRCFRDPGKVRRADVSFIRLARMSEEQFLKEGHCAIAPDFVVEVVSPNDLSEQVNAKRIEWQNAGAALVWIVQPVQQEVHAYATDGAVTVFRQADTLTAEPLLQGFSVAVAELFRRPTE